VSARSRGDRRLADGAGLCGVGVRSELRLRYALFGLGGHALFTGIFGAFLGLAVQTTRRWLRIIAPIAGLVTAIAAHTFNNALPLFLTLAGVVDEGEAARERLLEVEFVEAFISGTLLQLTIFLP
jgi:hypothetical protein